MFNDKATYMKARNPIAATTLEDDLIKQLIAYELILRSKGIGLFWDIEGCSVAKNQASALTCFEELLQENLNSRNRPTRITISTRNNYSHTTVTVSGEQYRVRPDRFSNELNALFAKLDSNYQFAVFADSWTLTLNLPSKQVENNGSSAAQRQIEAEMLPAV